MSNNKSKIEDLNLMRYHLQHYDHIPANIDYPNMSMTEMMLENCDKFHDYTALKYQMNGLVHKETFNDFAGNIERFAKLMKLSDIKKGEKVVVFLPDLPETYSIVYGALAPGAILVPLHPKEPKDKIRTAEKLRLVKPSVIICLDSNIKDLDEILSENKDIDENVRRIFYTTPVESLKKKWILSVINGVIEKKYLESDNSPKPYTPISNKFEALFPELKSANRYNGSYMENVKGEDDAEILFTSGTSGKMPTGCIHTHNGFNSLAISSKYICDCIEAGDKVIAIPGIFHGFGGGTATHTLFNCGTERLNVPNPTDLEYLAQITEKEHPEIQIHVPALLRKMKESKLFDDIFYENSKMFITGGAKMGAETYDYWANKIVSGIREGYGSTQTIGGNCVNPKNYQIKGSMGIPFPDYYYRIIDVNTGKNIIKPYIAGELVIAGPSVMRDSLNNKEDNGLFVENGRVWYHTNDLVYRDETGFYFHLDRIDDIINLSNGNLVNPFHIRQILEEFGIENTEIFKATNLETEADKIVACFEYHAEKEQIEDLLKRIKDRFKTSGLKSYEIPTEIVILRKAPVNLNGKIEKNGVKTAYENNDYVMKLKIGA